MTAAALTSFLAQANTTRAAVFGRTIKVAGTDTPAVFSAPRLDPHLDGSTVRVDKVRSTVRILKTDVPTITTLAQWLDSAITIQLPEASGYRTYRIIDQPMDIQLSGEWRLEVESV